MRHIARWGLMRGERESLQEHAAMTAILAHALAVIRRDVLNLPGQDPDACAAAALFHDATEILTGDLPTPVKYFGADIREAYQRVESAAAEKLCAMLPDALRPAYRPLLSGGDAEIRAAVKAADKLAAYLKCVEELAAGNAEFAVAAQNTLAKLRAIGRPEVDYFLENFAAGFGGNLDDLTGDAARKG
jgi:5'-deoxynucleotidase